MASTHFAHGRIGNHLLICKLRKTTIAFALALLVTSTQAAMVYTDQSRSVTGVVLAYDFNDASLDGWYTATNQAQPQLALKHVDDDGVTALQATYISAANGKSGSDANVKAPGLTLDAQTVRFVEIRYRTSSTTMKGGWQILWSDGSGNSEYLGIPASPVLSSTSYQTVIIAFSGPPADLWGDANGGGDVIHFRIDPFQSDLNLGKSLYIDYVKFGTGLAAIPEPSTYLAGALLLLPFGASVLRKLRKNRTASSLGQDCVFPPPP
jgi:hypothetical protein